MSNASQGKGAPAPVHQMKVIHYDDSLTNKLVKRQQIGNLEMVIHCEPTASVRAGLPQPLPVKNL